MVQGGRRLLAAATEGARVALLMMSCTYASQVVARATMRSRARAANYTVRGVAASPGSSANLRHATHSHSSRPASAPTTSGSAPTRAPAAFPRGVAAGEASAGRGGGAAAQRRQTGRGAGRGWRGRRRHARCGSARRRRGRPGSGPRRARAACVP